VLVLLADQSLEFRGQRRLVATDEAGGKLRVRVPGGGRCRGGALTVTASASTGASSDARARRGRTRGGDLPRGALALVNIERAHVRLKGCRTFWASSGPRSFCGPQF
jgi:hypothetical protein